MRRFLVLVAILVTLAMARPSSAVDFDVTLTGFARIASTPQPIKMQLSAIGIVSSPANALNGSLRFNENSDNISENFCDAMIDSTHSRVISSSGGTGSLILTFDTSQCASAPGAEGFMVFTFHAVENGSVSLTLQSFSVGLSLLGSNVQALAMSGFANSGTPVGPQGPPGPIGGIGPIGPQGNQGGTGPQGPPGASVAGVAPCKTDAQCLGCQFCSGAACTNKVADGSPCIVGTQCLSGACGAGNTCIASATAACE